MDRRTAIRNVVIISAGAALLPSCLQNDKAAIPLKNLTLTGKQEKLIIQLSDAIIPKSDFMGAADIKAHEFALMMVDDCYSPDEQKKFREGLVQFDKLAKDKMDKSFTDFTPEEKSKLLTAFENKEGVPQDALQFYQTVKKYTVQAFTSSEKYMTEVRHYKLVPGGNFKGCVPLAKKAA